LPGRRGTQWCDAGVLRLLRRRCLAKLRKEAEPVPAAALARFLPAWQQAGQPLAGPGAAPASRPGRAARRPLAGPDQVYEAIDQLAGAAVPASALEALVLPGRVPGYQPAILDELTSAGEVVWAGAGGLPGGDGWLVLAPAHVAPLLLPPPAEITMTPVHDALLAALDGGGALFFRMLADRVTSLLVAQEHTSPSDFEVAAAIWDLVWAGYLTNDTLAPLRTVLSTGGSPSTGAQRGRGAAGPRRGGRGGTAAEQLAAAAAGASGGTRPGGNGSGGNGSGGNGSGGNGSGSPGTGIAPGGAAYPAIGATSDANLGRLRAGGSAMIGRAASRRHGHG